MTLTAPTNRSFTRRSIGATGQPTMPSTARQTAASRSPATKTASSRPRCRARMIFRRLELCGPHHDFRRGTRSRDGRFHRHGRRVFVVAEHCPGPAVRARVPNEFPVAEITDTAGVKAASDYAATINWGDGTTTAASVYWFGPLYVADAGEHAYTDTQDHTMTVTVYDKDGASATASETVAAVPPPAGGIWRPCWGQTYNVAGNTFSGLVATFLGLDPERPPRRLQRLPRCPMRRRSPGRSPRGQSRTSSA